MIYNFANEADGIRVNAGDIYTDERGYGFVPEKNVNIKECDGCCATDSTDAPLRFDVKAEPNSTYNLKITIGGGKTGACVTVFTEYRRFAARDLRVDAGESRTVEVSVNVSDIHKHGAEYVHKDRLNIAVLGRGASLERVEITKADVPTIYFAGDSTVTDQPADYPYNPKSSYCGWGQVLSEYLKPGIAVSNHAQSGSTTEEFMMTNWQVVKNRLKPGDVLIVEFGHNDQKIESLDAFGGYAKNLRYYIDEARKRGAYVILNSPINRIIFDQNGHLVNLLGDYRNAVKKTAEDAGVPFVDLWSLTTEFMETAGPVLAWDYFWGDGENRDYTHTNDEGGHVVAKLFANACVKQHIKPICGFIKEDEIGVEPPNGRGDVSDMSKEMEHIKGIGLKNLPSGTELEDIDADITDKDITK